MERTIYRLKKKIQKLYGFNYDYDTKVIEYNYVKTSSLHTRYKKCIS